MGARVIRHRDATAKRCHETRALAFIIAAIAGPMLLTYLLIAADMRVDLSELRPVAGLAADGVLPVGWPDLAGAKGRIQILGYMMDGYTPVPEGTPVNTFILMPEAGHLLHPAHRTPDEMIDVRLDGGHPVAYSNRSLVRVTGWLRGNAAQREGRAAWSLERALVERAEERDLRQLTAHLVNRKRN